MPIYQYHCLSCGRDLEIFQHMTDPTLTVCPECQGQLRKVFSPVGIVFKGSGFYATDSKKGSASTAAVPAATNSTAATPGSDTGGAQKTTTDTPAATTPAKPAEPAATASKSAPAPQTSTK